MIALGRAPCDEAVIRAAPATQGCAAAAKPWVLAATILGSSLAFIDASVVNVALPAIQRDLTASLQDVQWIVDSYMLTLGALILLGGAAGDRYGRRRVFTWGTTLFTAASILCGLAPAAPALIAARALQGIGGALLVPTSLAIVSAAFPAAERGKAIGTWAGFSALTTSLGPILGGWLVDALSWRAIFFINLPVALAAIAISFRHVPESRDDRVAGAMDWSGAALATLGLAGLANGLTDASVLGWRHPAVLVSLVAGAALLVAFIRREARAPAPLMPLGLFGSRSFSGANLITLLLYFALGGAMFLLPFNLIRLQGYSAALVGTALLPFTLVMGVLSRWSGGLVERYGARRPLMLGPAVAAAGLALLALPDVGGSYWTSFFPALLVLGVGMAIAVAPLTTTVMAAVDERHAGVASGINNAVARIAGMLAVALLGAVAVGVFGMALDRRVAALQAPVELKRALADEVPKLAEAQVPPGAAETLRPVLEAALAQSFLDSFRIAMLIAAGLALASTLCAALMVEKPAAARRRKVSQTERGDRR